MFIRRFAQDSGGTIHNACVARVGLDMALLSLSTARDEDAQRVVALGDESLILEVGDEQQSRLTGMRPGCL